MNIYVIVVLMLSMHSTDVGAICLGWLWSTWVLLTVKIFRKMKKDAKIKLDTPVDVLLDVIDKELDNLRKAKEQFDALPKRKVLKMSELDEIPMVGKTVKYGLLPWLEKNGVYVDPKK